MKQVYSPASSVEAHMLKHLLASHDIEALIQGEALAGAAGELPVNDLLRIAVSEDDAVRARQILQDWEKAQPKPEPSAGYSKISNIALFATLAAGLAAGWFGHAFALHSGIAQGPATTVDRNDDGAADLTYFYEQGVSGHLTRVDTDNNFDGETDIRTSFDETSQPTRDRWDQDFNGTFETDSFYRQGVVRNTSIDSDDDGKPDIVWIYRDGVPNEMRIEDPATGATVRIDYLSKGLLTKSEIDADRDGRLDTRQTFDRYGEVTSTERF